MRLFFSLGFHFFCIMHSNLWILGLGSDFFLIRAYKSFVWFGNNKMLNIIFSIDGANAVS
jgi:hypothetical protein